MILAVFGASFKILLTLNGFVTCHQSNGVNKNHMFRPRQSAE